MRQLIVSDNTAPVFTNGVLAAGMVEIVEEAASGHISLAAGNGNFQGSSKFRFVQGTLAGVNVFSPWIDGKDIISWTGQTFTAQTIQETTLDFGVAAIVADGEITVKLISANQGQAQFPRDSFIIAVTAGQTALQVATAVRTAILANQPDYIATVDPLVGNTFNLEGAVFSLTLGTELASWRTASEGLDGTNGTTLTVTPVTAPSLGSGDAEIIAQLEQSLQGDKSFYNRIQQPNTPESVVDTATPAQYDVYTLRYRNSTPGSIHGVDNTREICIAYNTAGGVGDQANFELDLNTYLFSCPGHWAAINI